MTTPFALEIDTVRLMARHIPAPSNPTASASGTVGPTLVFLHEGLGSMAQWKDFPTALCTHLGLPGFMYERQGFGGSDPIATAPRPVDYLHREAQEVLPKVLAAAGLADSDIILIGHSDGGSIALLYGALSPLRLRAMVTMAAHVIVEDITVAGVEAAMDTYRTTNLKERLARYHGDKTDLTFRGWTETWTAPAFRPWDITAELATVSTPVLVMQGDGDEYGSIAQVDAIVAGCGGHAEPCLIPDCGHIPHLQARDAVMAAIGGFLEEQLSQIA